MELLQNNWVYAATAVAGLFILLLSMAYLKYRLRRKAFRTRQQAIQELFWKRRNLIPLLIELTIKVSSIKGVEREVEEMLRIRRELFNAGASFPDQIENEEKMTQVLDAFFKKAHQITSLQNEAVFLQLQREFADFRALTTADLENIKAI